MMALEDCFEIQDLKVSHRHCNKPTDLLTMVCVCVCERERERENSNSKTLFSKDYSLGSFRPV